MSIESGRYIITNANYNNVAFLPNSNKSGTSLQACLDEDGPGQEWKVKDCGSERYVITNFGHNMYASAISKKGEHVQGGEARDIWHIKKHDSSGNYTIDTEDGKLRWGLDSGSLRTPALLALGKIMLDDAPPSDKRCQWTMQKISRVDTAPPKEARIMAAELEKAKKEAAQAKAEVARKVAEGVEKAVQVEPPSQNENNAASVPNFLVGDNNLLADLTKSHKPALGRTDTAMEPSSDSELEPGTTFVAVVEEHKILDEFVVMVRKRTELDKKHLSALKDLRGSWNPDWDKSSVGPLISSLRQYLDEEIKIYEEANKQISSHFRTIPDHEASDGRSKDASEMAKCLKASHKESQQCKLQVQSDPSEILKVWRENIKNKGPDWTWVLPEIDREYRQAVIKQQEFVDTFKGWQEKVHPVIMQPYQERAEGIERFLRRYLCSLGGSAKNVLIFCSEALKSIGASPSGKIISSHHKNLETERSHVLLQPVLYYNYMLEGGAEPARPVFGLGLTNMKKIINLTMGRMKEEKMRSDRPTDSSSSWKSVLLAFNLEIKCLENSDPGVIKPNEMEIKDLEKLDLRATKTSEMLWYFKFGFWSSPPLIPLDEGLLRKSSRPRRASMSLYLNKISPSERQKILDITLRVWEFLATKGREKDAAVLLSHSTRAEPFYDDFCAKWDFEQDRPLPLGLKRRLDENQEIALFDSHGRKYI